MKIASNSPLAQRKHQWIDFDAASGSAEALYQFIRQTASGESPCKGESLREIAFHKTGVTL